MPFYERTTLYFRKDEASDAELLEERLIEIPCEAIKNDEDYERYLQEVEPLIEADPKPNTAAGKYLLILSKMLHDYEEMKLNKEKENASL